MPPPAVIAELPLMVLLVIVVVPALKIPPPYSDELPLIVLPVIVAVPALLMTRLVVITYS